MLYLILFSSPSLRGSGLKYLAFSQWSLLSAVSLFTREWIEICGGGGVPPPPGVSLFTREWIEISSGRKNPWNEKVSLFTREWIEMTGLDAMTMQGFSLPLYEGVD